LGSGARLLHDDWGETEVIQRLDPIFAALAPGIGDIPRTIGREKINRTAEQGYLTAAQMARSFRQDGAQRNRVRNYGGLRGGLSILRSANAGNEQTAQPMRKLRHCATPSTISTTESERHRGSLRRGSVIASWLLDLTAGALLRTQIFSKFAGHVSDSGEGRWTIKAAIDEAVPAPVLTTGALRAIQFSGRA